MTNCDLLAYVFPRLASAGYMHLLRILICTFTALFSSVVICQSNYFGLVSRQLKRAPAKTAYTVQGIYRFDGIVHFSKVALCSSYLEIRFSSAEVFSDYCYIYGYHCKENKHFCMVQSVQSYNASLCAIAVMYAT